MFRKVRELSSGQDRMKIQVHSSNNRTFYASGSCHMIIPKKLSSGEFHLVRNVPAVAARSPRQRYCSFKCQTLLPQPPCPDPQGREQACHGDRAGQGPSRGTLFFCYSPPHRATLSPRSHTHTCRHLHQGAGQRRRKPVGWKATSCSAKAFKKKIIFFKSPKTHTNTLGPHI